MESMFHSASAFNQPLNDWRVDKVTNMNHMFCGAAFNHPRSTANMEMFANVLRPTARRLETYVYRTMLERTFRTAAQ